MLAVKGKRKELRTRTRPGTAMYEVYYETGGEVPQCLLGAYTSETAANKDIEIYLSNRRSYNMKRDDSASSSR